MTVPLLPGNNTAAPAGYFLAQAIPEGSSLLWPQGEQVVPCLWTLLPPWSRLKNSSACSAKTMGNELLKKLLIRAKVDSARALIARWRVSLPAVVSGVAGSCTSFPFRRTDDRKDYRRSRHSDDTDVLRIHHVIGERPHMVIVGMARCFRRQAELWWQVCLRSMPNVFTGSCARMRCCFERKPAVPLLRNGHIPAEWLWKKVISDGALTGLSSAVITEKTAGHVRAGLLWPWGTALGGHYGRLQQWNSTGRHVERWNAASATSFRRLQ